MEGKNAALSLFFDSSFRKRGHYEYAHIHAAHSNFSVDDYCKVVLSISGVYASRKASVRVYDCRTRATISDSFAFPEADNADSFSKQDFFLSFFLLDFPIPLYNCEQAEISSLFRERH